jgi:glycosyltransferase involved in cell wall biosynthesis
MKIAHIAPPWFSVPPKNYGGTEIVLYNLIEEQVIQGHDVTLFAPGDARTSAKLVSFIPRSLIDAGVPWQAHLKAYYHLQKAVIAVNQGDFDIVHTHLSSGSDMYLFPLMADMRVPRIMTLHSRFPFDHLPNGWTGAADSLYMEWASSMPMVAISEHARKEVPYPLNFVGVVHHGLPANEIYPARAKRRDYFAWLGRCVPEKGAHLAIQAAKEAGIKLILAGTVDRHLPESLRYFTEQIKPHIDNEQIRYIGPVNTKEKASLFSGARAFLNPIQWEEPFGMVMIEAMAVGCPVISFNRGAAPELIVEGKTGFLVPDVDAMVRAIASIDTIDRNATRQHVAEHFSARVMAQNYTKVYQQVISASPRILSPVAGLLPILSSKETTLKTNGI